MEKIREVAIPSPNFRICKGLLNRQSRWHLPVHSMMELLMLLLAECLVGK
jgi:hypothetical protein